MARCKQELCEHWNGDICVCAAIEGEPDAIEALENWMHDFDEVEDEDSSRDLYNSRFGDD